MLQLALLLLGEAEPMGRGRSKFVSLDLWHSSNYTSHKDTTKERKKTILGRVL